MGDVSSFSNFDHIFISLKKCETQLLGGFNNCQQGEPTHGGVWILVVTADRQPDLQVR